MVRDQPGSSARLHISQKHQVTNARAAAQRAVAGSDGSVLGQSTRGSPSRWHWPRLFATVRKMVERELHGCLVCSRVRSSAILRTHELFTTLMCTACPNTRAKIFSWVPKPHQHAALSLGHFHQFPIESSESPSTMHHRLGARRLQQTFADFAARHPRGPKPKSFSHAVR